MSDLENSIARIATALEIIARNSQLQSIRDELGNEHKQETITEGLQARADYMRANWEDYFSATLYERDGKLYDKLHREVLMTPYGFRVKAEVDPRAM